MKKPEGWYGFSQVNCDLYEGGCSNMRPRSAQHYCLRKDRQGKDRPCYERLKCHWNVCPKLKKQRKDDGFKGWDMFGKEIGT